MSTVTFKLRHSARAGAVVSSAVLSLFIGFMAQASSPDYQRLFFGILLFLAIDGALIAFVCRSKERRKIWFVVIPAVLGAASLFEMMCRFWFGFRLL